MLGTFTSLSWRLWSGKHFGLGDHHYLEIFISWTADDPLYMLYSLVVYTHTLSHTHTRTHTYTHTPTYTHTHMHTHTHTHTYTHTHTRTHTHRLKEKWEKKMIN